MKTVVAVTGVTGNVGGKTLEMLRTAGVPVRAIVRRSEQAQALAARGIEARVADLGDRAAMSAALAGVDQLFLVTAATLEQQEHGENGVRAALDAGVRAILLLSSADTAEHSPAPWASALWRVEALVRASGLEWTILRPSGFMTNLELSAPVIRRGFFPQTMGRGRIPWIDTVDIARVASAMLEKGVHEGTEPILTGPELLDGRGVARALSAGLDRRVRYVHVPSRVFKAVLRLGGVPPWLAEGLRQQFGRIARHGLDGIDVQTDEVERLTGQPARSMSEWARSRRDIFLG